MLFVTCLMKQPSSQPLLPRTRLLSGPVIDYSFKDISALKGIGGLGAGMPSGSSAFTAASMHQPSVVGLEAVQPCSGRPRQLASTWSQAKAPNAAVTHPDATQAPGPVHQASMGHNTGRLQAGQQGSEVVQAVPAPTAVIAAAPESCRPALNSTAVRLSYNPLPSLAGLLAAMTNILDDPVSPSRLESLAGTQCAVQLCAMFASVAKSTCSLSGEQHLLGVFSDLPLHHYMSATPMTHLEYSLTQHVAGRTSVAGYLTLQAAPC